MSLNIRKRRDLTIVEMQQNCIVIACDSCGAIGEKENDVLKVETSTVGAFSTRVVLMEVLATGAKLVSVSNTVCNEMDITGEKIIKGISQELKKANIKVEVLNGSTEENFPTSMTAVGVTAIGIADKSKLKFTTCKKNDLIIQVGMPKCGAEVILENDKIASYDDVYSLLQAREVREIVPVGSRGIKYEVELLANLHQLSFVAVDEDLELLKSAGPATCVIAAVSPDYVSSHKVIGRFV